MRKNWILYIFLFLLLVSMLHESFWTGMFSVVKFFLIFLAIISIPLLIRFIIFMILMIKNFRAIKYSNSQNPFTFYSRTYGSNRGSTNYSRYNFNPFFRRNRKTEDSGSSSSSEAFKKSKVIEICPLCGYEKGENHICTNKN